MERAKFLVRSYVRTRLHKVSTRAERANDKLSLFLSPVARLTPRLKSLPSTSSRAPSCRRSCPPPSCSMRAGMRPLSLRTLRTRCSTRFRSDCVVWMTVITTCRWVSGEQRAGEQRKQDDADSQSHSQTMTPLLSSTADGTAARSTSGATRTSSTTRTTGSRSSRRGPRTCCRTSTLSASSPRAWSRCCNNPFNMPALYTSKVHGDREYTLTKLIQY
jgi:hypothetical protein